MLQAEAIIFRPAPIAISDTLAFRILLSRYSSWSSSKDSSSISTPTPASPFANSPQLSFDSFLQAEASTSKETDIPIIAVVALTAFLVPPLNRLNAASEVISSVNRTVIAVSDEASFLLSMSDNTRIDADRTPMAAAIFISVPALSFC